MATETSSVFTCPVMVFALDHKVTMHNVFYNYRAILLQE